VKLAVGVNVSPSSALLRLPSDPVMTMLPPDNAMDESVVVEPSDSVPLVGVSVTCMSAVPASTSLTLIALPLAAENRSAAFS